MQPLSVQTSLLSSVNRVLRLLELFINKLLPDTRTSEVSRDVYFHAQRITGLSQNHLVVSNDTLRASEHKKVILFNVTSNKNPDAQAELVQIRTNSRQEFRVYHHQAIADDWNSVAPRVYSAMERPPFAPGSHYFSIIVERVHIGLPDYSVGTARALAKKIAAISHLPIRKLPWASHYHRDLGSPVLLESFVREASARNLVTPELQNLIRDWDRIIGSYQGLRLVPCHNDLNYPNISYRVEQGEDKNVLFLDWKQFNLNYLGSDMHHLVKRSIAKPKFTGLFENTYKEYKNLIIEAHRVSEDEIDRAALTYALLRCLWRGVRTGGGVLQVNELGALYDRLARI